RRSPCRPSCERGAWAARARWVWFGLPWSVSSPGFELPGQGPAKSRACLLGIAPRGIPRSRSAAREDGDERQRRTAPPLEPEARVRGPALERRHAHEVGVEEDLAD